MLKHQNHYMFSMDIQVVFGVLIFHRYKAITRIIKVIALVSVKYGSNELGINGGANTILSGSNDGSVRLWDIRSGQQIQVFDGNTNEIWTVDYSPFVAKNIEVGGNSNVICSGSRDGIIRFWDIRSNKNELH
ncbi:hypothetical protein RFI_37846, partial [Reticulomyxa filosa]